MGETPAVVIFILIRRENKESATYTKPHRPFLTLLSAHAISGVNDSKIQFCPE